MNIKEPVVLKAPTIDTPDEQYKALAKRLGVSVAKNPSDMLLRHALSTLSIAVYDLTAVRRYLIQQRPTSHVFVWVPADGVSAPSILQAKYPRRYQLNGSPGTMRHGHFTGGQYNKPIPYPALLTMESIVKKGKEMGFTPQFYISDYMMREARPQRNQRFDPFLAVGTSDSDCLLVIERWDEPGFREEVYSTKKKASGKATGVKK